MVNINTKMQDTYVLFVSFIWEAIKIMKANKIIKKKSPSLQNI